MALHATAASLRSRRARAAHRRADDADPSRQASSGVRQQSQRRDREGARARRAGRSKISARNRRRFPKPSAPPCATTAAATANHSLFWTIMAPAAAASRPASSPTAITSAFGDFGKFKEKFERRRRRSLWFGLGLARRRQGRQAVDRVHRQSGQSAHGRQARRCSGSMFGSMRTTSSIRTAGPTISPRGGMW